MRLRFWLWLLDVAHACRAPRVVYFWLLDRASNATDWGDSADWPDDSGEEPF